VELIYRDLKTNKIIEYYVNDKFLKMFKRSYDDLLKMSASELSPEFQPNGDKSYEKLIEHYEKLKAKGNVEYEWAFIDKYGKLFHTDASLMGLKDEQAHITIALFRNKTQQVKDANKIKKQLAELSEQKTRMEKYIESNMQLENFAFMASHDLKTPLRNIVSFSQLLERSLDVKLNAEEREYLHFIKTGAKNMNALISGLLHYAKYEYNEFKKVKTEVLNVLESVIEDLQDEINKHEVKITHNGLPQFVVADKNSLYQLFYQLIKNAIFFKTENRSPLIDISYISSTTKHQFNIQDNGIGIEADYFEQIFLLFKKLNTNEKHTNPGIGLAICKKIVEQHAGSIWLDSELGKGSTFSFTLEKL